MKKPPSDADLEIILFLRSDPADDAQLFRESIPHLKELEEALRDHDAALSMGGDVTLGTHAVIVFADGR